MTTGTYLFKEGYSNLRKHGSKTFSTMLIICATMLVLGIFILLFQNINMNVDTIVKEQGLQALIEDTATDEDIEYMQDELKLLKGISSIEYLDREAAYQDAKELFAEQEYFLEGLENVDIFPRSFVIKFENIENSSEIKAAVEKVDGIYKVKYNEATINATISLSKIVNVFLLGIGIIMLIVSVFIISNTIKLAVYSNKREIFIMRYMGATNKFIRRPFIVEGAIMGIVSAIISFILISIGYIVLYSRLPKIGTTMGVFGFLPYSTLWYQILIAFVILGIIIGVVGSAISIKKYLKV